MLKKQLSCLVTVLALAFASTTGCNSNKDLFALQIKKYEDEADEYIKFLTNDLYI